MPAERFTHNKNSLSGLVHGLIAALLTRQSQLNCQYTNVVPPRAESRHPDLRGSGCHHFGVGWK